MKKIFALILTALISLEFVFAQSTSDEKYLGFIKDMRAGASFNFEFSAGELSEFVFASLGGGGAFEAGIPLPQFTNNSIVHMLLENFGASYRVSFNGSIMKDTCIDSLFSIRNTFGVFTRIPLPGNMFSIVPELNYGLVLNFPKASGNGSKYINSIYVDQVLQFAPSVRFTHPKMLNEKLELEFSPTYSFSPETGSTVHFAGFRLGVLYNFGSKAKGSVGSETNKSIETEHVQLTPELETQKDDLSERANILKIDFANLVEDAEENNLEILAQKYRGYEKEVDQIIIEIQSVDSEESLSAVEKRLIELEAKIGNLEVVEAEAELELDMEVTELAAKTGHAALIHHPDGTYTIAIPPLTFEANTTNLVDSEENIKSLDTLIEVLTTDERIVNMTVSVYGYINPDSQSELWTEEEKALALGRAESVAEYLIEHGCNHKVDSHVGKGYTTNIVFNRRVEFLVHN